MADIEGAVDDDRGRFLPARIVEVGEPGDAELPHILVVDVGQRAETLFVIAVADCAPIIAIAAGLEQGVGEVTVPLITYVVALLNPAAKTEEELEKAAEEPEKKAKK